MCVVRGNYMSNPTHGKWYKFNDTDVQCFDMSDATLEQECFGGSYKAKVYEQCTYAPPHACALVVTTGKCTSRSPSVFSIGALKRFHVM